MTGVGGQRVPGLHGPLANVDAARRNRLIARSVGRALLGSVALLVVYYLLPFGSWGVGLIGVIAVVGGTAIGLVFVHQLRAVAAAEFPALRAIEALAISTMVLLVAFAGSYMVLSRSDGAAFTEPLGHTASLYFTLTTLTTVGFGDITARSDVARVAVMLQMLADFAVLTVFIKLLLGIVRQRGLAAGGEAGSDDAVGGGGPA